MSAPTRELAGTNRTRGNANTREALNHPFEYAGVEAAEMKHYKSEQIEEAMLHNMNERGLKLWWPGASPLEAQAQLPTFFDLYTEMFGCCHDGTNGMQNMIDRNVRPLFEKLVSNEAGEIFKLPPMTELEPAVWEHLERAIKGDPTITRCRACHTKFNATHGEQV